MVLMKASVDGVYHNEDLFEKPNTFMPERFLESEFGTKPGVDSTGLRPDFHFGSGRVRSLRMTTISIANPLTHY